MTEAYKLRMWCLPLFPQRLGLGCRPGTVAKPFVLVTAGLDLKNQEENKYGNQSPKSMIIPRGDNEITKKHPLPLLLHLRWIDVGLYGKERQRRGL